MNAVSIKELQTNPTKLSKILLADESALITLNGEPLALVLPIDYNLNKIGLKPWASVKAFKNGDLSLGQLAETLSMNKHEVLDFLGDLNIPFADYDLTEDLETLGKLFDQEVVDS